MIDLVDVSKSYGPGLPAVNHANLHVDKGEFVFVVGSSGSGKSTLIKLLMKELDSTSGTITVSGERLEKMKHRRVAKYRRKLGVVFQDFRLLKDRNVYENVAFAQRVIGRPTRVIRKRVPEVLQEVGLAGKYKAYPDELSGGDTEYFEDAICTFDRSFDCVYCIDSDFRGLYRMCSGKLFDLYGKSETGNFIYYSISGAAAD